MMRTLNVAAVALSVLCIAGCRTEPAERAEPAGWPDGFSQFSIVWTAEKGVDLVRGPAVPVRAYIESFLLGKLTGDEKYVYPGFTDATEEQLRPSYSSPADGAWIGTMTNHLLSVQRSGDDVTAIGCMYTYGAASPHGKDEYDAQAVPPGAPEAGIAAFKVTLRAPSESSDSNDPQQGPARTPFGDVFAGYRVTGYDGGYFGAEGQDPLWPEYQSATADCLAKAPDPLDRRKYLTTNYLSSSDFQTLRPAPGWPAKPAS
jgi:hypothetical protein